MSAGSVVPFSHSSTMSDRTTLKVVFGISAFGALFSGTLTWQELVGTTAMSCPSPGVPGTVFGYPACVYGFVMYTALAAISGLGLWRNRPLRGVIRGPGPGTGTARGG